MSKDVQRTCQNCGHTWRLPKRLANESAPSRWEMGSRKMMAAGSSATPFSRERAADQLRLANAQAKLDRVMANGRCPQCGSGDFTQAAPPPVQKAVPVRKPRPSYASLYGQPEWDQVHAVLDPLLDRMEAEGQRWRARSIRKDLAWLRKMAAKPTK